MKKIALTIIVSLVTIVGQAQEHLRFMGIPIEGTVEQFANRLVTEKGLVIADWNEYEDPNFKMEAKMLNGSFEMFDECLFVVRKIEGAEETSSVFVYIDSLKCMNGEFDKLNDLYDKKYGEHSGYWGNNKWESNGGRILAGSQEGGCYVVFMDKSEVEIRDAFVEKRMKATQDSIVNYIMDIRKEKETVKEICGVPFGSSYEKTKEMLENKYGYPEW